MIRLTKTAHFTTAVKLYFAHKINLFGLVDIWLLSDATWNRTVKSRNAKFKVSLKQLICEIGARSWHQDRYHMLLMIILYSSLFNKGKCVCSLEKIYSAGNTVSHDNLIYSINYYLLILMIPQLYTGSRNIYSPLYLYIKIFCHNYSIKRTTIKSL